MAMSLSSRSRLNRHSLDRFQGDSLFDKIARAVCEAECLPRKELYEAWEVARRTRRLFRGGRIVDLAAGHGLLAFALLLLDNTSPEAICVDLVRPPSAERLERVLMEQWPRLRGRVHYQQKSMSEFELSPQDLVVSSHPCGPLTDEVLDRAARARARVVVLPCCHDLRTSDLGSLDGWMDGPLAADAVRVLALRSRGYRVRTQLIPAAITPKNRLILAEPIETATPPAIPIQPPGSSLPPKSPTESR